ncbi:MAG: carbamate kinase [Chloroflexi bacterium]|nr:carbamate kinase [Chloroflexota bacterium]
MTQRRGNGRVGNRVVIALGGNAINPPKDTSLSDHHGWEVLQQTTEELAQLIRAGYEVALVHGNGPQVGALLLQNEAARAQVPLATLDVCDAETQGQLGYMIQQLLGNQLRRLGVAKTVVSLVSQVVVDPADAAFLQPTKPIGPVYGRERAQELARERGYAVREVHPGAWRRAVSSPRPLRLVEAPALEAMLAAGLVPVVAGGGGIPVAERDGQLSGVEAVVDKDYSAELVATELRASTLVILTDVDRVYLDYETAQARPLERLTLAEGRRYLKQGHFPPGSMGPKVEACLRFLEHGGLSAVIAPLPGAEGAVKGVVGTRISG